VLDPCFARVHDLQLGSWKSLGVIPSKLLARWDARSMAPERTSPYARAMPLLSRGQWICCWVWVVACARAEPQPRDDTDNDRVMAEVAAVHARYQAVLEPFLAALAARQPAAAYALLAPVYQNMVSEVSFARRIGQNKNFAQAPSVKVLSTSSQAGTTKARVILGALGLAEVTFLEGPAGPRISALTLAGSPALPLPE
jgi:hypothetical protein